MATVSPQAREHLESPTTVLENACRRIVLRTDQITRMLRTQDERGPKNLLVQAMTCENSNTLPLLPWTRYHALAKGDHNFAIMSPLMLYKIVLTFSDHSIRAWDKMTEDELSATDKLTDSPLSTPEEVDVF